VDQEKQLEMVFVAAIGAVSAVAFTLVVDLIWRRPWIVAAVFVGGVGAVVLEIVTDKEKA